MVMGSSYFVKKLSKTDVGKRLALLTKYMKHLPCIPCGHPVANLLEVMDVHETEWYLGYTFRRLSPFCEMQMSHTRRSDHIYTIGVKRSTKLLGNGVWTDVF
ncbi:hypothetical protein GOBAR_AA38231 [Gossypium barbadense]|uniref:Uncharacterized protein n=1 Tax=Gossypium barbadense TaxID=3634 RepID=A0A2P5VUJ1_GOSBA|nr:hypothetical protein GOBAR_AA38231 [Gossypium barbadense]